MLRPLLVFIALAGSVCADEPLETQFEKTVSPFLKSYCDQCHGAKRQEGKLDLSGFTSAAKVGQQHAVWETLLERVEAGEMPPESAKARPAADERKAVVAWIRAFRDQEAARRSGDPGPVLARRLSNAEFDYSIRDLTGVDIRPTTEFPVDPANEAGFDNSGESLAMSPALLKKYLAAVRHIADHVVLKPQGFVFAPHAAVTDTDRDKYCVYRIVDFYKRHSVDYADYFEAAWRFRHRDALGKPNASLAEFARDAGLSQKYLATIHTLLSGEEPKAGPLAAVRAMMKQLPPPGAQEPRAARAGCEQIRDFVVLLRKEYAPRVERLHANGISDGSQPLVLWRNRQLAGQHRRYPGGGVAADRRSFEQKLARSDGELPIHFAVEPVGPAEKTSYVLWSGVHFRRTSGPKREGLKQRLTLREVLEKHLPEEAARLGFGKHPRGQAIDADSFAMPASREVTLKIPAAALFEDRQDGWSLVADVAIDASHDAAGAIRIVCRQVAGGGLVDAVSRERYLAPRDDPAIRPIEAEFEKFCDVFPDAFFLSDRPPYFDQNGGNSGRLLTAGFHLMQGYFRDDAPLRELVLDEPGQKELDSLWRELSFVTRVGARQYKDFIFFERAEPPRYMQEAEFDFARSEDKDAISEEKMNRLRDMYIAKARRTGSSETALEAMQTYFTEMSAEIRGVEKARLAAEPSHLQSLLDFAERAWRRPLSPAERDDLLAFYKQLREKEELSHEDAIRDSLASVLMSPNFCYRFDLALPGAAVRPLTDNELASRLSYFLWSSLPDAELLARARAGELHRPEVIAAQARRMVRDPRVRALATEFGGNWLDIRRFEEHNAVDRERFPAFTGELRQAMFEEPIRFLVDLMQQDRPVLDCLYGRHTFVNAVLAKHYGMPVPSGEAWVRVDDAGRYGRGGLLPMSVFLTKNAPGLRTSPVKRGYWVVRRLLGEHIPAPPPEVPELPRDESQLGDLTLPQVLAKHREHRSCAVCHVRFDSIGLVFEGFGPVGERREKDLGGKPVQTTATFPDGSTGAGLDGLQTYLRERRQNDFVDNFCRKLLAYALGRSLLLSDRQTLDAMRRQLTAGEGRFQGLVDTIVTSPQFLNKRGDSE